MRAVRFLALLALATSATAQAQTAPETAFNAEIRQAIDCAAINSVLKGIIDSGPEPDATAQENLDKRSKRWLDHAVDLEPTSQDAIFAAYTARSRSLITQWLEAVGAGAQSPETGTLFTNCVEAETQVFGNSLIRPQ